MGLLPLDLVWARAEEHRSDGVVPFEELMYVGEAVFKTYVVGIVAGVDDDPDRHRYKLTHRLVRANSLGDWDDVLAELSTGTSVQHLRPAAVEAQQELTTRHGPGSWMHEAVIRLDQCLRTFLPDAEQLPTKFDGRKWFTHFVYLRNKTRGHGAPTERQKISVATDLELSLKLLCANAKIFETAWAFLKRNLSLKYHVVPLNGRAEGFSALKSEKAKALSFEDGVYVDFQQPVRIELIESTADSIDFFYPNGHFRGRKMEWLSYVSGTRRDGDGTPFLAPTSELPRSHTEGFNAMRVVGRCFANQPAVSPSRSNSMACRTLRARCRDIAR